MAVMPGSPSDLRPRKPPSWATQRTAWRTVGKGVGTLGYVADLVGISKRELMEHARRRGVLPQYDERYVEQDLQR